MYVEYYHLSTDPFRLSPDHRFDFLHKSYEKCRAYMRYAIHRAEGFAMITGATGTGKTTLSQDLIDAPDSETVIVGRLVSTRLPADELLRMIAFCFGLEVEGLDKASVLRLLEQFLKKLNAQQQRALLVVDEAQNLSESALEELRLLTNLQTGGGHLIQVVLLGQECLRAAMRAPAMEQLHQRLVAASHLEPMDDAETREYIDHRLNCAGWSGDPAISDDAYAAVYRFSLGVPRRINLLCSRLLLHGCALEKHALDRDDVTTVVQELQHEELTPFDDTINSLCFSEQELAAKDQRSLESVDLSPTRLTTADKEEESEKAEHAVWTGALSPEETETGDSQPGEQLPISDTTDNPSEDLGAGTSTARPDESELPSSTAIGKSVREDKAPLPIPDIQAKQPEPEKRPIRPGSVYLVTTAILVLVVATIYAIDPRVIEPSAWEIKAWRFEASPGMTETPVPAQEFPIPTEDVSIEQPRPAATTPSRPADWGPQRTTQNSTTDPPVSALENATSTQEQAEAPGKPDQSITAPEQASTAQDSGLLLEQQHHRPGPTAVAQQIGTQPPAASADTAQGVRTTNGAESASISRTNVARGEPVGTTTPLLHDRRRAGADEDSLATVESTATDEPPTTVAITTVTGDTPVPTRADKTTIPSTSLAPSVSQQPREFPVQLAARGYRIVRNIGLEAELGQLAPVQRLRDNSIWLALNAEQTFNTGNFYIRPTLWPTLNRLATILADHSDSFVRLVGHSDSTGTEAVNLALSTGRADAVAGYLSSRGIAAERLFTEGKGSSEPRASNATRGGRQLNRRVEIFVSPVVRRQRPLAPPANAGPTIDQP